MKPLRSPCHPRGGSLTDIRDISHKRCWGGKEPGAARRIANILNTVRHTKYVEPMLGKGNVWRAKDPSPIEILNDKSCKRVNFAKRKTCSTKDLTKCKRLAEAKLTCGKDYKQVSRANDGKDTLHYFDPPWPSSQPRLSYKDERVDFDDFVKFARSLKGKVAISYSDKPAYRKALCKRPFTCKTIRKNSVGNWVTEILAVKR